MRLISLTANKKSFRPIYFNRSGLSFIVGKQKTPEIFDPGKTYNGVGKSLAIYLIHFCLGSNKNDNLERAIPDWEFTLKFELNGKEFVSTRNTSFQDKIYLNGEEMAVRKFCATLETKVFAIPTPIKHLKFRPLLSRFIRPRKESYISFDSVRSRENPYEKLLCNAFLLGIEIDLITEKHRLKLERDRIKTFRENLNDDSVFLDFFTENKNVEIELKDFDDKINQLTRDLKAFQVAENYSEIQKKADETKRTLQAMKNNGVIITNAIENINISLEVRPDLPLEKLIKIYNETKVVLPESVIKEMKEVTEFHNKLISNRVKRLTAEKARFEGEFRSLRKDIASLSRTLDSQLQFLSTYGALDEFVELSNYLSDLKTKAQKIRDYKSLLERYSDQTQEINIALSNETKRANIYLKEAKNLFDENLEKFRSFSKRFYLDKPGGLTVKNNEGDNQIRFDIEARIQDDAADGINEVKIFCFDMTILMGRHNHNMELLFHDSRLFSNIDPRQKATLFKIAYACAHKGDVQYIATVNEDQINSMRDQFTDEEFNQIIKNNIVLELTDDSPSSKLLGIQVDLQYDLQARANGSKKAKKLKKSHYKDATAELALVSE